MSENFYINRILGVKIPDPSKRRIAVITGARQTGKTTLSKWKYPGLKYINLDSPENRDALARLPTASWGDIIGPAVLDESQKAPEVFEKVKYAFDEGDITFTVLTGSSQILLLKKVRESLAGRAFFYELWPLMQCEINSAETKQISRPLIHRVITENSMSEAFGQVPPVLIDKEEARGIQTEEYMLKWGGMPALKPLDAPERWEWLQNYGHTYLERDLADLARLNDLTPFRLFQKLSALRSGGLLNYSELARDAGVSVDTARHYLEYLRLSYQVFLLQPYYRNITSSVVKTPKLYWADIGILRQLTGFRGDCTGELYETMVVGEIMKWLKTVRSASTIYFYRTRSGMELDLLLETGNGIAGIEIKSRKSVADKDFRPMREVANCLGSQWKGGIIVNRGNEIRHIGDPDIWMVPSRRLFQ